MGNSPVDRNTSYMKEVWGTTSLVSDYWSLPHQPRGNGEKRQLNEVVYDQAHIADLKKQVQLHEKIRNDDDYDDWEYGTEPDIGVNLTEQYNQIPKRY